MKKTLQLGWVTKRGSATPRKPTKPAPGKGEEPKLETIIICILNSGGWRYTIKLYKIGRFRGNENRPRKNISGFSPTQYFDGM